MRLLLTLWAIAFDISRIVCAFRQFQSRILLNALSDALVLSYNFATWFIILASDLTFLGLELVVGSESD